LVKEQILQRKEAIYLYIFLFCTYSFMGWIWEVALFIFVDKGFVNRGFLHGPWLPIYGVCGVLFLLLLRRWKQKPVLVFCLTLALVAAIEYISAWTLDTIYQTRWWDYSHYPLNLHGYITLPVLLLFTAGGVWSIYWLTPKLSMMFAKIPKQIKIPLLTILILMFILDLSVSLIQPNISEGNIFPVP